MYKVEIRTTSKFEKDKFIGCYETHDQALAVAIDCLLADRDIFHKCINTTKNELLDLCNMCGIRIVKQDYLYENFDFNNIKEVTEYSIVENLLITNIGVYVMSVEELEKFQKLIIFK